MFRKALPLFVIPAVAAAVVLVAGCVCAPKAVSDEDVWGKFVGEWVNPVYLGRNPDVQRWEIGSDFVVRWFNLATRSCLRD